MAADLGGDGFKSLTELIEFDDKSAQGVRFPVADAVLLDDGAQFGSPVESGFGDSSTLGDGDESDRREPAWDPWRLHTLEVRMEHDGKEPINKAVPA
jgi:hypothetical protein